MLEDRKRLIEELHLGGYSYQKIGRVLGVSRQRVHQILKDYKNTGLRRRKEISKIPMGVCTECNSDKAVILHHKDYDNSNDIPSNLQPVCEACHTNLHTGFRYYPPARYQKQVSTRITEEDHEVLRRESFESKKPISEILRNAVSIYLTGISEYESKIRDIASRKDITMEKVVRRAVTKYIKFQEAKEKIKKEQG